MVYSTLIRILWKKEKVHWSRLGGMWKNTSSFLDKVLIYPLVCIGITFFHYCFATMHFLFETFMYFFNRKRFERNMKLESNKKGLA